MASVVQPSDLLAPSSNHVNYVPMTVAQGVAAVRHELIELLHHSKPASAIAIAMAAAAVAADTTAASLFESAPIIATAAAMEAATHHARAVAADALHRQLGVQDELLSRADHVAEIKSDIAVLLRMLVAIMVMTGEAIAGPHSMTYERIAFLCAKYDVAIPAALANALDYDAIEAAEPLLTNIVGEYDIHQLTRIQHVADFQEAIDQEVYSIGLTRALGTLDAGSPSMSYRTLDLTSTDPTATDPTSVSMLYPKVTSQVVNLVHHHNIQRGPIGLLHYYGSMSHDSAHLFECAGDALESGLPAKELEPIPVIADLRAQLARLQEDNAHLQEEANHFRALYSGVVQGPPTPIMLASQSPPYLGPAVQQPQSPAYAEDDADSHVTQPISPYDGMEL